MSDLIEIEQTTALDVFLAPKGLDPYLLKIRSEIDAFVPNMATTKGRGEIASMAARVAKSKTYLDGVGKALVDRLKEQPKLIDAERKRMRDTLDQWRDEVRKPLTDYENAERARVQSIQFRIAGIRNVPDYFASSTYVTARIAVLDSIIIDDSFAEFANEAAMAKDAARKQLDGMLANMQEIESLRAKAEEERRAREEHERKEREERLITEAEERAKRDAEAKAQAEIEAAKRREIEARIAQEKAEQEARMAEIKATMEREQQAQRIEAARRAEQERIEKEQAEAKAADEKRAADAAHRSRIIIEAVQSLVDAGVEMDAASHLIDLISIGMINHVKIIF